MKRELRMLYSVTIYLHHCHNSMSQSLSKWVARSPEDLLSRFRQQLKKMIIDEGEILAEQHMLLWATFWPKNKIQNLAISWESIFVKHERPSLLATAVVNRLPHFGPKLSRFESLNCWSVPVILDLWLSEKPKTTLKPRNKVLTCLAMYSPSFAM